ncbi:MAG TPA: SDR family NAD(P)-dependent oxidoreductase [Dermatophilaceae bacterium]|nr:SDR family NAD(P)-dependent oxidoreductase [Dermatophilaceae bacterium]
MQVRPALDWAMDKSLVLGYTRIGPRLRRRWWPADPAPDALAGRDVLVTGATGGLGLATAVDLAALGATVHLLGRGQARLDDARDEVLARRPGSNASAVHTHRCDVSDLNDVDRCCARLADQIEHLHGLVHNAGVLPPARATSAQGHELTLATHVLGPHRMTYRLADLLAGGGRVVVVSSGGMYSQPLPTDDYEYEAGEYSGVTAYARTKRMQVVLAELWAQRLAGRSIEVHSMHPGWVDTPGVSDSIPGFARVMRPLLRTPADGADTIVWLLATDLPRGTGRFWHDRRPRPTQYLPRRRETQDGRSRLWEFVTATTGLPRPV